MVFEVNPSEENDAKFMVHEEFTSKAAFNNHQSRVKNSQWGKISADVERHYQIEEVPI